MRRVLLTGASGFLGRHCLDRLLREGCEIVAVARRPGDSDNDNDNVRWYAADLRDPVAAGRMIADLRPSHVLHLAWEATPGRYSQSPDNLLWLQATMAMAMAFGEAGGTRFVGGGSSAEYGTVDEPCREDTALIQPASIYGKCKAACWLALAAAAQHHGFGAAWGRIFLPYGPGDPPQRLIPSVLASLRAGRAIDTTHGRQQRDFIYATDIADMLVRLLFSDAPGVFNVGSGVATPVRQVVEYLAEKCGGSDLPRFGAINAAPGDPPMLVADMSKVRAQLGWSAPTSLKAGLDAVLADGG